MCPGATHTVKAHAGQPEFGDRLDVVENRIGTRRVRIDQPETDEPVWVARERARQQPVVGTVDLWLDEDGALDALAAMWESSSSTVA